MTIADPAAGTHSIITRQHLVTTSTYQFSLARSLPDVLKGTWAVDIIDVYQETLNMTVAADPIIVTEAAANKITQLLDEEQKTDGGLRVFVQGGGCSGFQYGLMIEDGVGDAEVDKIFRSHGVTIFVDPISIRYLTGAEVDFVDNLSGGGFMIKNPTAKTTCGCGQSFGV